MRLKTFSTGQIGVTAIEYAIIGSLVAIAVVAGAGLIGTDLSATFTTLAGKL